MKTEQLKTNIMCVHLLQRNTRYYEQIITSYIWIIEKTTDLLNEIKD